VQEKEVTILSAQSIRALSETYGMIEPFVPEKVREVDGRGIVSYGLGSAGYDLQLSDTWKVCQLRKYAPRTSVVLDVKNPATWHVIQETTGDVCIIPPGSFALASSVERFKIPPDIMGLAFGKSTYARLGINALVTPLEPKWEGFLTIEIANNSPYPAMVYAGEGMVQIIFAELDQATDAPYQGRYQDQRAGVTMPSIEK
jgi:dCTP deaminase